MPKLFFKTGTGKWEEAAKNGLHGKDGKTPIKGVDYFDGKDAPAPDMDFAKTIADVAVKNHEREVSHDPFLVGTKTLTEEGMKEGDVITYEGGDKLGYSTIKQVAAKVSRLAGRGLSLPSQSSRTDRILQTDGSRARWGMKITVSATQPTSPELNDIWIDTSA